MNQPFFSIIIPTYNRAHLLPIAIKSVISQSFQDWELIIINDGSTDDTENVVRYFQDKRIKYLYQENQERSVARNNGVLYSTGKYICFLDSDDYYLSDRLQLLYKKIFELNEPNALLYTGVCLRKNDVIEQRVEKFVNEYKNKYDYFMHSHIHCQQSCIPREILIKNQFNKDFYIAEDTELWFRIITNNDFIFLKDQNTVVVTDYDDRSINVKRNNVYKEVLRVFNFVKKNYNYPFSKSTNTYIYRDCHFGIARYYIYQNNRFKALFNLLLSLYYDIRQKQFRYRLNIAINLIFNFKKAMLLIENN